MLRFTPLIFTLLFALAVLLADGGGVAPAQAQQTSIDLSIDVRTSTYRGISDNIGNWFFEATNHGSEDAYGVMVRIEMPEQVLDRPARRDFEVVGNEPLAFLWNVGKLEGGSSKTAVVSPKLAPGVEAVGTFPTALAVRARAVISNSFPLEPENLLYNNADEDWLSATSDFGKGRASVGGNVSPEVNLGNRLPQDGDTVVLDFTLRASCPRSSHCRAYGYRLRIRLPPGLGAPTADVSAGRDAWTFTPVPGQERQWDWVIETVNVDDPVISLSVPVTDRAALLGQCVTAELTVERPADDPSDNLVRTCFGEEPTVLFGTGETDLFTLYPCVGVSAYPCTSADTLEVGVIGGSAGTSVGLLSPEAVMQPDKVVVHVPDPGGRVVDNNSNSVNGSGGVSWQTANTWGPAVANGVEITLSLSEFNDQLSNWTNVVRTMSVRGLIDADAVDQVCDPGDPSPPCGPGRMKIRFDYNGSVFFDPNPTYTRPPLSLNINRNPSAIFAEFEELGTYVVEYKATAVHTDTTTYPDGLTGTGTYTFHVGPVAEFEVGDGGAVPDLAADQYAITVLASNNGPDPAPDAEVTIDLTLPEGVTVASHVASAGMYDNGVWEIGRLPDKGYYRAAGRRLGGEDLILILQGENAANATATATIENTEDYERCLDADGNDVPVTGADDTAREAACLAQTGASWHSTHYFDYIEENNTATIVAQPGTGGGAPGTPRSLSVLTYADPPIAVVTWGPVESVNGWPVSGYELWADRGEETCRKPRADQAGEEVTGRVHLDYSVNPNELTCYYVRAVNTQKVPGYWSEPALTAAGISDLTQLTVQGGAGVVEGGDAQFTISASPAPVAGDTLQVQYTVSQRGNFVAGLDLGQDSVIIDSRGRADITVPTEADETGEADGAVVLTLLSGSGYALSSARSASVAVADDDDPTVSFAEPAAGVVKENAGPHNVVIQVEPAPHEDFPIGYTTEGDAVAGAGVNGDYTISGSSNGSGTVMARAGQTSVVIPVQPTDNGHSEPDESLILWLSQGDGYALGSLQVYSLTIVDDDGPRAEFARAESGVDEDGGTYDVVINLDPSPAGNVSINYQMGGPATRDVDYSIAGVTGPTASVSASAGDSSVTIPVNITDDSLTEGDERLELTLLPSSDYNLGTQRTHALTIRDNDLPRVSFAAAASNAGEGGDMYDVTVRLDQPAPSDFTLRYGVGGDATRNRDYRVADTALVTATATSVAIPVDITDDGDNEPDETVVLTLRAGSGYAVGDPSEHTLTIADDDPPLVAFAAASASVSERGGAHRATILLEPGPHADITVRYTVDGTATEGDDFTFTTSDCGSDPCTAMVGRGQGRAAVPIDILNDGDAEGDETVVLTLLSGYGYDLALPVRYELTIKDDDAPVATFTAASGEVAEGDSGSVIPHNVEVKLDRPAPAGGTLLTFSVSSPPNIGATSSDDYGVPATMTARVQAGDSSTDIPVTIVGDGDNEADEIVVLTLDPGRGYSVGSADEYTLTIVDDDHDENTPVASLNNPNFHGTGATQLEWWEDGGAARPTWHVTGNFTGDVIFQYVGGTATLHEDFTVERIQGQTIEKAGDVFTVRSLESPQDFDRDTGVRWARFIFNPIRDDRAEGRETAIFRVLNGPGYTVGEPTELTIIIKD